MRCSADSVQAMQQMQQANGPMAQPMLHQQQQSQHGFTSLGFQQRSQESMPGRSSNGSHAVDALPLFPK